MGKPNIVQMDFISRWTLAATTAELNGDDFRLSLVASEPYTPLAEVRMPDILFKCGTRGKMTNAKSARIALASIIAGSLLLASCGKEASAQVVLATNNVGQLTNASPAQTQEQRELLELTQKAEKGDPSAEFSLGKRYETGSGVESNQTEAAKWFRKAAEHGSAQAESSLGDCYYNGSGVESNQTEAVKWFRKAAEQGDAGAQCSLSFCYILGLGVEKNPTEAFKWSHKAVEQGDTNALVCLAICYTAGLGVEKNPTEAFKLYLKAAEQGNTLGQFFLASCYYNGLGVESNPTKAVKWYRKAAEQANALAQCSLANCYYSGSGVAKNLTDAVKWFRKAAEQGNVDAQCTLATCYYNGSGVEKNPTEAVKWYLKAVEQGDARAQCSLASCYYSGFGVGKNLTEAVKWYRKAAEQGHALAQYSLGVCYVNGEGVPKDLVEAYNWCNLAASQGDTNAADERERLALSMTPAQIAEAQRLSSEFVAKNEGTNRTDSAVQPTIVDRPKSNGTGFCIAPGYFLTCNHVITDATAIKVVTGGVSYQARLVNADSANDVALLKVDGLKDTVSVLPVLNSRDIHLGDSVFTIGFPNIDLQGVEPKLTRGEINSLSGVQDDLRFFQMSVAVQPGNSGGALLDMRGDVVGIVAARLDEKITLEASGMLPQNVNYALKSSFILAFLDTIPELTGKMPAPHVEKDRKFEDVVKEAQSASAMVLVY
ncbi:MAG: trypsin-like peptidase domain-containing protein [Verrucomicrobiia bacterium]